ncbi:MAG: hypothetical protein CMP48_14435 [Rickettsiales bacterium]|nr:hypothetical protein [Rickettsiales bacterium]
MKNILLITLIGIIGCSQPKQEKNTQEPPKLSSIESPHGLGANLPYLTSDRNGNLYHSWVEKNQDTSILKTSKFTNGEWSTPETIATGNDWFVNWADYPMIAANNYGKMAHFLQKSSSETFSYDVTLTTSKGGEWSDTFKAHNDGTQTEHGFVTMLPLTDSTFQVAWLDGRNSAGAGHDDHGHGKGAMTLRTAVIDLDGNITEEAELDNRTCDCCQTGGTMTSNGPIFIYRDRSELEIRDIYIVRKVDEEWTAPQPVAQDNWNIAGCPVNGPRTEAFGDALAVAWYTAANGQPQVKIVFSNDAGATFGEPIIVDRGLPLGRVDLVMLDKQSAMISWLTQEGTETLIKTQKVYMNGVTETPIVISKTSGSRGSGFPQMAKSGNEVFYAWTSLSGDSTEIKMAKVVL